MGVFFFIIAISAIHLEVVNSLSADEYNMAIRRSTTNKEISLLITKIQLR